VGKKHGARYVAVDLGAESGRVIVGSLDGLEVVHRFGNHPVRVGDSLYWDLPRIFSEIKVGLREAFRRSPAGRIRSIGVDSWGVDYGLLDEQGDLIGTPYHYRDARTDGAPEELWKTVSRREIYDETGIQYLQLNTIYQLFAHRRARPEDFRRARTFLSFPSLLNYRLTGKALNEYSHVTTTQLYNPRTRDWSWRLVDAIGLERGLFGPIIAPGTALGPLLPALAEELDAEPGIQVVAPATHDTACAVAGVPAADSAGYAYISSGTWSLEGIESPQPIISDGSYRYDFTNEGAADGGVRFLKNVVGLWIVQECKRHWDRGEREYSYGELAEMAEAAGPARFRIDPNDPRFFKPGLADDSMPDRVRAFCRETGQPEPGEPGHLIRGVLESLAELYARILEQLREVTGHPVRVIHIIGGGSRNRLLCRLTAQATGLPVQAGPVEATAIGNILLQALAMGEIASIAEGRQRVRRAFPPQACGSD
jgi:rhamnulokinase